MKNLIIVLIATLTLNSCAQKGSTDKKKITIDNFNEKFLDSLIPIPDKSYAVFYTKIEGNSNDTIRLNISPDKSEDPNGNYYFIGDFKKEIRMDYYGESIQYITLDPYKATKGKVKLTYML